MTRLLLVRHGESTWNRERRLQGQAMGPELTELGHAQARTAAEAVAAMVAAAPQTVRLLSSDQRRALQTARPVAATLGCAIEIEPRLREQHLGALEGRLVDELEELPVPPGEHLSEIGWGGGESLRDVHARATHLVIGLRRAPPADTVVLVSHGDTMRVLLAVIAGRGHREVEWPAIGNGEVLERMVGCCDG